MNSDAASIRIIVVPEEFIGRLSKDAAIHQKLGYRPFVMHNISVVNNFRKRTKI